MARSFRVQQRKNALALHTVDHGDALALERHRDDLRFLGWQFERAARTGREVHEPQTRLARALCTVALHHDLGDRLQVVSARPGPGSLGIRLPLRHRSEEHTSELQSPMRISYAVFCLKKKIKKQKRTTMIEHKKQQT